tara:strand:- start:692 stop:2152 length:1461 start_codon:yes stop_codon:yes gene_type:complete
MAIGIDSSNPSSYELEILTIVNNEGDGFDVRSLMLSCNIYESIKRNFLLGELIIADSIAFLENGKLFGQESLRVRFRQPTGIKSDNTHDEDTIDQIFRIYKIDNVSRIDDNTQVFKISFCSPELIKAKRKKISQALKGSMTDLAAKLAEEHLGIINKSINTKLQPYFEVREKSQGDNYHILIPNWSVNYCINWLCKQAQGVDSNSGLQDSFFWYQTAVGGYRIQSLKSMMTTEYAGGRPFTYASATSADGKDESYDSSDTKLGMGRRILAYSIKQHADVLTGIVTGLFASKQTTIDNTYKFYTEKTYNFLEKHFSGNDSIDPHPFVRTEPETLYIGSAADEGDVNIVSSEEGRAISDYSDGLHILSSDSSFVNDDKDKIHQANHFTHLGSEQFRNAAEQLLNYHTLNVTLSARTDISVGQVINLDIPAVRPGEQQVEPKFYNGNHLITEIMWALSPNECTTNIKCIKDSVLNNIETTKIEYGETET